MVGPNIEILSTGRYIDPDTETCIDLESALGQDRYYGIGPSLTLLKIMREADVSYAEVNVRVGKQPLSVETSGCLVGEEKIIETNRNVVIDCPTEKSKRCGQCILEVLEKGKDAHSVLKNSAQGPMTADHIPY